MDLDVTQSVLARYSEGAEARQADLCCPVDYDASLLALLPPEIIEKDYGCGDPSRYVQAGDVVLDLGSGGGKICYMAAQLVGSEGRVIGVDMNDDMLHLARKHQSAMAEKLGGDRVEFLKGRIQDLSLGIEAVEVYLQAHPVTSQETLTAFEQWQKAQRVAQPLVADQSVDLVISNCVLNLVDEADRLHMIAEIFRVLKPGGRVAISDIICDQPVPTHLKNDTTLWSGCISGAFETEQFLQVFKQAGFHGVRYDKWDLQPWQTVEDIAFRSVTLTAAKPVDLPSTQTVYSVIYRGPFDTATDDCGQVYVRGCRVLIDQAACAALKTSAYADCFVFVDEASAAPTPSSNTGGCCG